MRIRAEGENLVRALAPSTAFAPRAPAPWSATQALAARRRPDPATTAPVAIVEASGLPNLLHELVHVALAGRLADDHGIDYQAIPYDLGTPAGRAVLWDELAACVVSCAYLLPTQPSLGDWVRVDSWFDEQLGIQPIFYGMDGDPARFWATLPERTTQHEAECAAMSACAYERVAALLAAAADYRVAPPRLDFAALWQRRGAR